MAYCSDDDLEGFTDDPKIIAFLNEFPFIKESFSRLLNRGTSGMIQMDVQRIDNAFMQRPIETLRIPLLPAFIEKLFPPIRPGAEAAYVLDEHGNILIEVGKSGKRYYTETYYEALLRMESAELNRVKYVLHYQDRRRIPGITIYKMPKDCSLVEFMTRYEERGKELVRTRLNQV
jgi:hypothetical protein